MWPISTNSSNRREDSAMRRNMFFATVGVVFLLGANVFAQDQPTALEINMDYSLVNFHASVPGSTNANLNGGGGSIVYYTPIKWFGLKMDLQGYGSTVQNFNIPVGNTILPKGGVFEVNGNLFTYLFGPVIKKRGKIEPYGQLLIGGGHNNVYANLASAAALKSTAPANDAFAMTVGGGLDIHVSKAISFRPVEVGYLLTHFGNDFTGGKNQNSFRYEAGITLNFH